VRTLTLPNDLRDVVISDGHLYVSRFRSAEILMVGDDGAVVSRVLPPLQVESTRSSPTVAWRMRPYRDGSALVIHQYALDGVVPTTSGGYGGSVESCAQLMESAVSVVHPDGSTSLVARLRSAVLPVDVAAMTDGAQLAVVAAGNAHTSQLAQVMRADANATAAMGCGSNEQAADQTRQPHGEAVAAAFLPDGAVLVQTRQPAALEVLGNAAIALSTESRADTGHAIFHAAAGAPLACASCHPEGGDDGHVWTFSGSGARRTQSLRGGISGTAPFHWDGDLPGLPQLYAEILTRRMSGPALDDGQQRELTRFIDSLPALPAGEATEAATRGQALFASSGCGACHVAPAMTNNLTVDVGTGGAFQTPSLRGVRWRAPYLHDGCAATLADRFGPCGGGDRHGVAGKLSAAEISDLVAYLETL
jgi:hypothetical protein